MKSLRLFSMMLIASLFFAACSKDKTEPSNANPNPSTPAKTPKELIIGKWQITSMVYTKFGGEAIEDCDKDNTMEIKTDGIYTIDQGAVKCSPSASQSENGKWTMDNYPALYLKLDNPSAEGTMSKILQLDNTTLKVLQYEGEDVEITLTFKRL